MSLQHQRIMCEGCRALFTLPELKIHLSIDRGVEQAQPRDVNNRGNRLSTAPPFNINDPRLFLERCPKRLERFGRAGALRADAVAPESLPIVLPCVMPRQQLETLRQTLLDNWMAFQQRKSKEASAAALQRDEKCAVAPSASSSARPRAGRNMLVDDAVRGMFKRTDPVTLPTEAAAPIVKTRLSVPLRAHSGGQRGDTASLPSYMQPLRRADRGASGIAPSTQRASSSQRASSGQVAHVDPQAGTSRPGRGGGSYVRISNGQVVPIYVRQ